MIDAVKVSLESSCSDYIVLGLDSLWSLIMLDLVARVVQLVGGHVGVVWHIGPSDGTFAGPTRSGSVEVVRGEVSAGGYDADSILNSYLLCGVGRVGSVVVGLAFKRKGVVGELRTLLMDHLVRTPIL